MGLRKSAKPESTTASRDVDSTWKLISQRSNLTHSYRFSSALRSLSTAMATSEVLVLSSPPRWPSTPTSPPRAAFTQLSSSPELPSPSKLLSRIRSTWSDGHKSISTLGASGSVHTQAPTKAHPRLGNGSTNSFAIFDLTGKALDGADQGSDLLRKEKKKVGHEKSKAPSKRPKAPSTKSCTSSGELDMKSRSGHVKNASGDLQSSRSTKARRAEKVLGEAQTKIAKGKVTKPLRVGGKPQQALSNLRADENEDANIGLSCTRPTNDDKLPRLELEKACARRRGWTPTDDDSFQPIESLCAEGPPTIDLSTDKSTSQARENVNFSTLVRTFGFVGEEKQWETPCSASSRIVEGVRKRRKIDVNP